MSPIFGSSAQALFEGSNARLNLTRAEMVLDFALNVNTLHAANVYIVGFECDSKRSLSCIP